MVEPILRSAAVREADRRIIADGTPGAELMRRAGEAVARAALKMAPDSARIFVLCGPGNNGGDGFVAAAELARAGRDVQVVCLVPAEALQGDAGQARALWSGPVEDAAGVDPAGAGLIVDALFGTGLGRELDSRTTRLIARVAEARVPVLAIDVPSGIDADTGTVRGAALRAARTVTFACRKPGHLLYPGRAYAGALEIADTGIPGGLLAELSGGLAVNGPDLWRTDFPEPAADGHKYGRGHALAVSGGPAHTGAARLAARAALRAGAGLVTLATPEAALATNAAHLTAVMLRVCDDAAAFGTLLQDRRFSSVVLGPALGVGRETRDLVRVALAAGRPVVLDADALTSFAGDAATLARLIGRRAERPVVLTPHDSEFARLFATPDGDPSPVTSPASKLDRALAAASLAGAVVVLKGADTVIAAPDGRAAINQNGSPYLATAGSGDVLGGIVAGLLAQGVPGYEAACAAVWLHAEAGARFGPGLIAEDIAEGLPAVLRDLYEAG